MLAIAADCFGITRKGGTMTPNGRASRWRTFSEDSEIFSGISRRMIEDPSNQDFSG
ncbi:hypothetical protein ACFSTD_21075 [Novosphingobium colocasiae]